MKRPAIVSSVNPIPPEMTNCAINVWRSKKTNPCNNLEKSTYVSILTNPIPPEMKKCAETNHLPSFKSYLSVRFPEIFNSMWPKFVSIGSILLVLTLVTKIFLIITIWSLLGCLWYGKFGGIVPHPVSHFNEFGLETRSGPDETVERSISWLHKELMQWF